MQGICVFSFSVNPGMRKVKFKLVCYCFANTMGSDLMDFSLMNPARAA